MSKANKVFAAISARSWINSISDTRAEGGNITVTLKEGWFFTATPEMSIRSFATVRETAMGCSKNTVFNPTLTKVKKPRVKAVPSAVATPATEVAVEAKPEKAISMTADAIRKREKRAQAKVAAAELATSELVA